MENRMAMYSRALGVMGAHYSGPGFGVSGIEEKKEVPDFIKDKKKDEDEKEKAQKVCRDEVRTAHYLATRYSGVLPKVSCDRSH